MAAFQVSIDGRFWVFTEAPGCQHPAFERWREEGGMNREPRQPEVSLQQASVLLPDEVVSSLLGGPPDSRIRYPEDVAQSQLVEDCVGYGLVEKYGIDRL